MWSETLRVSRVIEWKWVPALLSSPDISHNTVEEENTLQSMSIKFYLLQKKTFRYPPKYLNCFSNQFLIERIVLSNTSIGSGDWRGEEGWWQWYCTGCGRGEGRKNWFPRLWAAPAIYLLQHIKQKLNKAFYYTLATLHCTTLQQDRDRGESWWDPVLILTFLGSVTNQEWRGNSSANHFHVLPDVDIPWPVPPNDLFNYFEYSLSQLMRVDE